ncbi:MAG: hypothetical protein JJ846_007795 [Prochlorococcus marinus CUG1437]|nr:hypothetical protein [Prochlorococcus marinus CUG1437]
MKKKVGFLFITFIRTSFINKILKKLYSKNYDLIIYQNLPEPSKPNSTKQSERILRKFLEGKKNVSYIRPKKHLSAGDSIEYAITYGTQYYDYLLIVEDDITLLDNAEYFIKNTIKELSKNQKIASISLYSPFINLPKVLNYDKQKFTYLNSNFAHSWGWILKTKYWQNFDSKKFLEKELKILSYKGLYEKLLFKTIFGLAKLSSLGIIKTWDYQWNMYCWVNNYSHLLLIPSLSKDNGNKDKKATNSLNSSTADPIDLRNENIKNFNFLDKKNSNIITLKNIDYLYLTKHHNLGFNRILIINLLANINPKIANFIFKNLRKTRSFLNKFK